MTTEAFGYGLIAAGISVGLIGLLHLTLVIVGD
jgi:Flp pilus assembly pilin Flp